MKIFLDSDVLLDYLTARDPFLNEIKIIIDLGLKKELELFTSSLIAANIHYFISKTENAKKARAKLAQLTKFIKILNVGEKEILEAIGSKFKDFEDSIQNASARNAKLKVIVTRNIKDFKHSELAIMTPKEFLDSIE